MFYPAWRRWVAAQKKGGPQKRSALLRSVTGDYELLVDLDNSAGTHGAAYPIWIHPNGDPLIEILGRSEFALAEILLRGVEDAAPYGEFTAHLRRAAFGGVEGGRTENGRTANAVRPFKKRYGRLRITR